MTNYKGRIVVIGDLSYNNMTAISTCFSQSLGQMPDSCVQQPKDGKKQVTYSFSDLESKRIDPWDIAATVWDLLDEYAWVGVFLTADSHKIDDRFTYEQYKEYRE